MSNRGLRLHPKDNCIVTLADVRQGETIEYEGGAVIARADIDIAHKVSIASIAPGEKVCKYGAIIGSATVPVVPGDHIHTHNLTSDYIVGFHH